eukprot:TRINITY_DN5673_c0_g1_i1.p1 TRINITY_DN5673_c0_g1~~TRINITY_DN5673_c0_g1_i1.p1  ORF type:complete len:150 (-),score=44.17 TRINITY_DN5673_c0_g1_i1:14-463(-)
MGKLKKQKKRKQRIGPYVTPDAPTAIAAAPSDTSPSMTTPSNFTFEGIIPPTFSFSNSVFAQHKEVEKAETEEPKKETIGQMRKRHHMELKRFKKEIKDLQDERQRMKKTANKLQLREFSRKIVQKKEDFEERQAAELLTLKDANDDEE